MDSLSINTDKRQRDCQPAITKQEQPVSPSASSHGFYLLASSVRYRRASEGLRIIVRIHAALPRRKLEGNGLKLENPGSRILNKIDLVTTCSNKYQFLSLVYALCTEILVDVGMWRLTASNSLLRRDLGNHRAKYSGCPHKSARRFDDGANTDKQGT